MRKALPYPDVIIFLFPAATGLLFIFFVFVTPSQQGFFCDDATIKKPRLKDTVSALYLLIGGVAVPIICVSISRVSISWNNWLNINSLWPGDAHIRQWTGFALVPVMTFRLFTGNNYPSQYRNGDIVTLLKIFDQNDNISASVNGELWNPLSKAVPDKFHGSGGHNKHNCLQYRANFHRSRPLKIV